MCTSFLVECSELAWFNVGCPVPTELLETLTGFWQSSIKGLPRYN